MDHFLLSFWLQMFFCAVTKLVICQQSYSGNLALDCDSKDAAVPYSCNGEKPSCKAFLISWTIIHSLPPSDAPLVVPVQLFKCRKLRKSRQRNTGWIVLGVSSTVLSLILAWVIISLLRKKKLVLPEDFFNGNSTIDQGLRIHEFEELKQATGDFSSRVNKRVYEGMISGPEDEYYLLYIYMENDSLKDWLHKSGSSVVDEAQSWSPRLQIALDIANGLSYLHNFTGTPYVHKDTSSSNILLDADLRAKIANFSLARSAEVAL
ncbi:unnamed protein product [Linum tenue]|uniref:Protein kinase domain-containing protein n=1 Tax=Linum tenue TaxID=586396 RepID=A0AAV0L5T8_9ROSI|nr:unnamed protein product [Linum tenue]